MPFTRNPMNVQDIPAERGLGAGFALLAGHLASDNLASRGISWGNQLTVGVRTNSTAPSGGTTTVGAAAGNLNGVYVTFATSGGAGSATFTHGLGRTPLGYWEVRRSQGTPLASVPVTISGTATGASTIILAQIPVFYSVTAAVTITAGSTTATTGGWNASMAAMSSPFPQTASVTWLFI